MSSAYIWFSAVTPLWDSTTGRPEPLGDRGAWAADNVATDDSVQDRPEEAREGEKLTQAAPQVKDAKEEA